MQPCYIFNNLAAWNSKSPNPDKSLCVFPRCAAGEKTNWGSPTAGCVTWPQKSSSSSLQTQRRTSFPSPNSQMSLLLGKCPPTWCPPVCLSRQHRSLMFGNQSHCWQRGFTKPPQNMCEFSKFSYIYYHFFLHLSVLKLHITWQRGNSH